MHSAYAPLGRFWVFGECGHAEVHKSCTLLMQVSAERENAGFEVMQLCISHASPYARFDRYEI